MKSMIRTTLIPLAAILAMSMVGAASASAALPEFTVETPFAGSAGGPLFESVGSNRWNYTSAGLEGAEKKTTVQGVNIRFHNGGAYNCVNVTNPKGERELLWKELKGKLGYIDKEEGNKKVGLLLEPIKQPIAKCEVPKWFEETYSGSLILEITPINRQTTHFTLTAQQSGGEQMPSGFEGADTSSLFVKFGAGAPEEAGLVMTMELTTTRETEIRA